MVSILRSPYSALFPHALLPLHSSPHPRLFAGQAQARLSAAQAKVGWSVCQGRGNLYSHQTWLRLSAGQIRALLSVCLTWVASCTSARACLSVVTPGLPVCSFDLGLLLCMPDWAPCPAPATGNRKLPVLPSITASQFPKIPLPHSSRSSRSFYRLIGRSIRPSLCSFLLRLRGGACAHRCKAPVFGDHEKRPLVP